MAHRGARCKSVGRPAASACRTWQVGDRNDGDAGRRYRPGSTEAIDGTARRVGLARTDLLRRLGRGSRSRTTVVSPSTGEELTTIGTASADDVNRASARATVAQREWAALPYNERAAVLRRAGDLWHANAEEIIGWLMRESGAIGPFGGFQIMTSAEECYEAAALASAPYGELLRSSSPRLSLSRRTPVGVVGVISPFNVPDHPVDPRRRSGAGARQRGHPQARPADRGLRRCRAGRALRPGRVCPTASCTSSPAASTPARPSSPTRSSASSPSPARPAPVAQVAELAARHLKRVHLELGGNSAMLVLDDVDVDAASSVGAWGSFAHQGQVCMTTGRHLVMSSIADEYVAALSARADHLPVGDPTTGPGRARPGHRRRAARQDPRDGDRVGGRGRPAGRRRHVRGPLLPADGARRRAR